MACRYTYNGTTYSASEFMRVLSDIKPTEAAKFMPGVNPVPNAPFVNSTDEWAMLAFKRMVRYASEHGFDRVAWTTGEQQAERYDLSKQVDRIAITKTGGAWVVNAWKDGDKAITKDAPTDADLAAVVGKELAERAINEGGGDYAGVDLKVGGEGMRAFYDAILPKAVNKWAKPFGAKTGRADFGGDVGATHAIDLTPKMRNAALSGLPMFSRPTDAEVEALVAQYANVDGAPSAEQIATAVKQYRDTERAYGGRPAYDKAKADGRTKLTYGQWVQVRTPNFKRWFGDWMNDPANASKVVDPETGEPMVVYHGTAGMSVFDTAKRPVWLTGDADIAHHYAGYNAQSVMPLFANLKAPLEADGADDVTGVLSDAGWDSDRISDLRDSIGYDDEYSWKWIDESRDVVNTLLGEGYDGAKVYDDTANLTEDSPLADEHGEYGTLDHQSWVVFSPNAIKSATGNIGTFNGNTSDIRFSRQDAGETWLGRASDRVAGAMERTAKAVDARVQGDRSIPSHWTPEQQDAAKKFETFMPRSPIADRVRAIRNATGERIVQKVFDQYRSLRSLSETAWMQAHLSRGTETTLEAIVTRGIPELRDGAIAISEGSKSFLDTLRELGGPEEQNRFFMYVVGQRARALADEHSVFVGGQQVRTLRNQEDAIQFATQIATEQALSESPKRVTVKHTSRERLFTENDINALLSMADGKSPDGRARKSTYAKAQREMTAYQSALLDIAEKAGLVNPESRKDWETDFYIPFYRVMTNDDGSVSTRFATGETGLIRQEVIKRLKGGKENLGDPLTNLLSNWSHLLSASMKNMAANNALAQAEGSGIANRVEAGDVWTMIDGKRAYWEVADPGIVESLAALDFNGYNNAFMRAAGKTKRLLTMGVTIAPGFRIRNLVRDVVHAIAVTDAGYNPLAIAIQGWKSSGKDSEMLSQMLAGGGAMRFGAFTDGDSGDVVRGMLRRHISPDQIITTAEGLQAAIGKSFEAYMDLGDRMENVSRAVVYDRAMKRTGSHLIASFEARDVMNFTSMGSSAATRAMAQVLPFFNARLQGLHKLGRGAKENPKRFLSTIGVIGMASALLYLLNADDDEYRALPDYVRDTYWPIKVGGRWLYVPKPFEVGAMATVIERFTEMAFAGNDYQARDFRDTVVSILVNNLSMNPVPQIILPSAEAWYNYDMFRDRPIDSMSMQRLLPEDRYDASTSAGAVVVGRALGVSPQKLEHLVSGYFGWIGIQALNVSDYIARSLVDFSESPKRDFNNVQNWFVVGDFVKEDTPSKYVERFYAMQRDIDQIYATANYARASGDYERYRELMSDPSLQYRPLTRSAANRIALLNRQSRAVISDRNMTAEEKTQKLRAIRVATNAVARSVDEQVRRSTAQQTR